MVAKSALCLAPFLLASAESPYSFITLGDWGGYALGSYHATAAKAVAKQMGKTAAENHIKSLINTGDNFYYCGIKNTSDFQIALDYTSIYTAPSLQVPWYSILGNHEYGYNVDAQIEFSKVDPTGRWVMPARYYTERLELASGQYMSLIFLDTNPCIKQYRSSDNKGWDPCGSDFPTCDPIDLGPCEFNANILAQDCQAQFTWLQKQLQAVDPNDWLVVVGHHPADEIDVEDFTSVIQQHGFDLYLNGHSHTLQQYSVDGSGAYVTSGAGSMVATKDQENDKRCLGLDSQETLQASSGHSYKSIFNSKTAGFTLHSFNEDFTKLTTQFVSYKGKVLHSFVTTKRGVDPSPTPTPPPTPVPSPVPTPPAPTPTPTPTPTPPAPTPGPRRCCYDDACGDCDSETDYCSASDANCKDCSGKMCGGESLFSI